MRALILGLDGATFQVLTPLLQAGHLPNLQKLLAQGVSSTLYSTIPPITALAWTTFMTGKNPGKHGLLGWQAPLNAQFERPFTNARQIQGSKLWDLLAAQDLRVCVMNVPVTYPPEPVNGVLVSGMLTPSLTVNFTYPVELQQRLLHRFPSYQTDISVHNVQRHTDNTAAVRQFLAHAQAVTEVRGASFRWLIEQEQPDVAMLVFELPDRLQHVLWNYIAALPEPVDGSPHAQAVRDLLLAAYRKVDEEIGAILALETAAPYTFVLSDHGFGPLSTNLYLNDWLQQQGLLAYNQGRVSGWQILRRIGKHFKRWIPGALIARGLQSVPLWKTIDWQKTQAYAGLPTEYGIFLNVAGREPLGQVQTAAYEPLREQLIQRLQALHDPLNGKPIFKAVYRREEVYQGPFVDQAPDIIFELHSGYRLSELTSPVAGRFCEPNPQASLGWHEAEGVFAMAGPGMAADVALVSAHIQDVMPTILYALGLPIPSDLDGKVLVDGFLPDRLAAQPIAIQEAELALPRSEKETTYSSAEVDQVAKRLRDLGYLS
ncbi:MAG: alkaline phosphatase family protein [Caldilineaceae bacterium]|nr:alkaline phosphatase family protein [Caldilineaceae bacterium]